MAVLEIPPLSGADLDRIQRRLEDLIEVIGPRDARGILELTQVHRDHINYFMDWLSEAYGSSTDGE